MIRFGVLGTARINRRVLPALRASRRAALVAVASRTRDRALACAREWDIPAAVTGYRDLLGRDDIDAVYVPLPNTLHVEWTLAAVRSGKHVLCEKPIAIDAGDVDLLEAEAARARVVVEEGYMYRHEPLTRRVKELVEGGAIGGVRAIVSGFTFSLSGAANIRLDPSLGGGALWDIGGYPISYASLLTGEAPTKAIGAARWTETGVDEECAGVLHYPGGATASVYAGFRAEYRTWLEVMGSIGSLSVPNPFRPGTREVVTLEREGRSEHVEVAGSDVPFVRQIEDFISTILDGAPSVVSLDESRRTIAATAALYQSARAGEAR